MLLTAMISAIGAGVRGVCRESTHTHLEIGESKYMQDTLGKGDETN